MKRHCCPAGSLGQVFVCLWAALAQAPAAAAQGPARRLVVATTCDLHGALGDLGAGGPGAAGEGGVLALSAYVETLRAEFPGQVLLVDAGDLYVGSLASRASQGAAVIEAYNLIGYDAAALGNHEFDFGRQVLSERIRQAKFPFLAANVDLLPPSPRPGAAAPRPFPEVRPGVIVMRGGVRVGIVGAATPWTPATTQPRHVDGLRFVAPRARVVREAQALRQAGAEVVLLAAHMGAACHRFADPADIAGSCQPTEASELFALVASLPPGTIDIAVGGHTHALVAHWLGGVPILQAGTRGQHLVWMEAAVAPGGGLVRADSRIHAPEEVCLTTWADGQCLRRPGGAGAASTEATPLPRSFRGRPLAPDPAVAAAMRPHLAQVAQLARAPAGCRLPQALDPMALCSLAAGAMQRRTGADFALQNTGGFRTTLGPGEIDQGTLFEAMPFDNALVVATLSGAQLNALAGTMHACGTHGGPPFCLSGLQKNADGTLAQPGAAGGPPAPLHPTRHYRLATNAFIAQGGEGADAVFATLPKGAVVPAEAGVAEALADALRRAYPAPALPADRRSD